MKQAKQSSYLMKRIMIALLGLQFLSGCAAMVPLIISGGTSDASFCTQSADFKVAYRTESSQSQKSQSSTYGMPVACAQ